MDSIEKGYPSNKKTEQPGTYTILSFLLSQIAINNETEEEGHTHSLRPHCKRKWNMLR